MCAETDVNQGHVFAIGDGCPFKVCLRWHNCGLAMPSRQTHPDKVFMPDFVSRIDEDTGLVVMPPKGCWAIEHAEGMNGASMTGECGRGAWAICNAFEERVVQDGR